MYRDTEGFPRGHRTQTVSAFTSVPGYAGPLSSLRATPDSAVLLSEGQSGVHYLLGFSHQGVTTTEIDRESKRVREKESESGVCE